MTRVCGLKVEGLTAPLGIGCANPRFSWRTESDISGFIQEACRIEVFSGETVIWDSGDMATAESLNISGCPRLSGQTAYHWRVSV